MSDLSPHFSKKEFACKCGCGFDTPDPKLVEALEKLRSRLGVPLTINSACRCEAHNKAEGGSPKSQHLQGKAADVRVPPGHSVSSIAFHAESIDAFRRGGIGKYPNKGFVHLDVRANGPARWTQ